jgi:hypothetical protein
MHILADRALSIALVQVLVVARVELAIGPEVAFVGVVAGVPADVRITGAKNDEKQSRP